MATAREKRTAVYEVIAGMSANDLKSLDPYNSEGQRKDPSDMYYLLWPESIMLLPPALAFVSLWFVKNPKSIGALVRQWAGIEGEEEFKKRLQNHLAKNS
jgi:hypothetical protein